MDNVLVVYNFNAGRKKAVFQKKELTKFLLNSCKIFKFISIDEFDNADIKDFDTVIAIGGDGTINKIVSRIINTDKTLICMPSGTANLLASNLGMTNNIKKNLKIILKGNTKKIDIIKIDNTISVLRCGFGYDSDIICKTPQSLKNKFGYFAYFIAGIIFALRLKNKIYKIKIDNEQKELYGSCIIIANAANMYKNFVSVGNNSKVDDGLLDIFVLKTQNPILFFAEFIKIIFGLKKNNFLAEYFQAKKINLQNNWTVCHVDGEKHILKGDTTFEIISNALNVYCK